jgi:hypothetical protein
MELSSYSKEVAINQIKNDLEDSAISEEDKLLSVFRPHLFLPNDDLIAPSFSYLPPEDSSVCHLCGTKVLGNGRVNRRKHFNQRHKLSQTYEVVELSSESENEEFGIKNALDKKPTLSHSNNPLSVLRPLHSNDDSNSTFSFIKRQDKSQCQVCGQFVQGKGNSCREMHFNSEHKEQRDQLKILNNVEKVARKSQDILSGHVEDGEWKELGM